MNLLSNAHLRFCLLILAVAGQFGCQSAKQSGSMSHASVQIQGHSVADIQQTATAVFGQQNYRLAAATPGEMVFERPGSRRDALKWGGWAGNGVTMRVKVVLSQMPDASHLLEANAYAVQNSDDPFFQTESRNILLNRRPYQELLNEVGRRLK